MAKNLFLFTAQYPYGKVSETFLETEILFLAKEFDTIYILPSSTAETIRKTPENVQVITDFINLKPTKSEKIKALFARPFSTAKIIYSEIKDKGFSVFFKNRKVLLDYLSQQLMYASKIKSLVVKEIDTAVCYNYWFCNVGTLALTLLKQQNKQLKVVARAHRYDLYDERWGVIGVPFRKWKMQRIDTLYLISEHGLNYMKEKINSVYHTKLHLSRLGVTKLISENNPKTDSLTFISISRVASFKQLYKIPALLNQLDIPVKWILYGDGAGMEEVQAAAKLVSENVTIEFKGHVANHIMLEELRSLAIDFFISLSSSEGLPVSMMEVQSLGIPILSTAVGGIPEIVIDGQTGFLFSDKEDEWIITLQKAIQYPFEKEHIIRFFDKNFNAEINYSQFAKKLCSYVN